ncbi:MAG: hypothetical protein LIP16_10030 [Clostridium sp.]|nr:hypothetical protein [Clostridium sp.]
MIEILIIADDMTGMLDAEAQFANRGILSDAFLGDITIEDLNNCGARVAAVTTESRHLSKEQAYEKVFRIADLAKKAGVGTIFKKTDSVLRGHVGTELTAVMHAAGSSQILFFPAYPEQNRITKDGVQYVEGVPIAESIFGNDRLDPVISSFIPEILASETEAHIQVVTGDKSWDEEGQRQTIYIFDAVNEEQLYKHILKAKAHNRMRAIAGCAGLAKELAEIMSGSRAGEKVVNPNDKLFAVCGSFNRVTKNQVKYAADHGFAYFPVCIGDLAGGADEYAFDYKRIAAEIREACRQKKSIVIAPEGGDAKVLKLKEDLRLSADIVNRLNSLLMECMDELEGYTLFHTGGDTLSSFIHLSGCRRITSCGEVLPGIAINKLIFGAYEKYVISKSGGFGDREVLVNCINQGQEGRERKII